MNRIPFIIFILYCLMTNVCLGQNNCENSIFYKISLDSVISKSEKRFLVRFNYRMSNSLQKSLFESSILSDSEKAILKQELSDTITEPICEKIELMVEEFKGRPSKNGLYISVSYPKPIFVSEKKVYLFHDALFLRENFSGVKGGSNILETFILEDSAWKLKGKKILEVY